MHEHTCNKRALPRSRARANSWVPGYASLSRLNPDSIHLGGESRLDPNYCASVNTALGCTLCMYNVYMYVHVHVHAQTCIHRDAECTVHAITFGHRTITDQYTHVTDHVRLWSVKMSERDNARIINYIAYWPAVRAQIILLWAPHPTLFIPRARPLGKANDSVGATTWFL